ncbi:cupin domain-containing protein [Membranihabitans maritimus]|uniref:cupin domain-containing protein n=1 Tax=Membranihabitans maritimus TaxID=2904244 RepID=UPI001F336035|nr:cupin domain-containing protein [Membranihabitans maritimus]
MKYILPILTLIIASTVIFGQSQNTSDHHLIQQETGKSVASGLYTLEKASKEQIIFSGTTTHFSKAIFQLESLSKKEGKQQLRLEEEQIVIIREGEAMVSLGRETKTIGPNSVFLILPGEQGTIVSVTPDVSFYRMIYKADNPTNPAKINRDISSFIIDYDDLVFNESSKGGVRKYFNTSTAMCPYYEMHVTTLKPGMKSHEQHTHEAAEIILMIEGETEEEIGDKTYRGRRGDLYFLASNVPHAIKNVGDKPCQYFAFQWGAK